MPNELTAPELIRDLQLLGQGLIALLLGGLIGWEREAQGKWAGLRTHMLVCFASAMIVDMGRLLIIDSQAVLDPDSLRVDPVRLIEAIVAGVSFLGAGTIFRDRDGQRMHGLTTAASLLATVPLGIAVGIGRYILAVGLTLIVLFVLRVMAWVEKRVGLKNKDE
ncbi:MAG TPA: MgtC/SapB family protein [Herpetosiphonaceae bacterium]|nr:MgtC/SapB family protein [Herpetosiphonaceae bacterium]